jgi:hypothetical protein
MSFSLLMFAIVFNSVLPNLKLLAFAFLLENLEIFLCLLLVSNLKISPLLDVYKPQMPFEYILTYLANIWLHLIIY